MAPTVFNWTAMHEPVLLGLPPTPQDVHHVCLLPRTCSSLLLAFQRWQTLGKVLASRPVSSAQPPTAKKPPPASPPLKGRGSSDSYSGWRNRGACRQRLWGGTSLKVFSICSSEALVYFRRAAVMSRGERISPPGSKIQSLQSENDFIFKRRLFQNSISPPPSRREQKDFFHSFCACWAPVFLSFSWAWWIILVDLWVICWMF